MALIASIAGKYIEQKKAYFIHKYYARHKEGAVILFFGKDGTLYEDKFMSKDEIIKSSSLPDNAYSEAKEYWDKFPHQLVFLSWFFPIQYGTPFSIYALGTIKIEVPINLIAQHHQDTNINTNSTDCFIVTATFDTPDAIEVLRYREFRDKYLIKTRLGRNFINFYYYIGPQMAKVIKSNSLLKNISRKILSILSKILP